MINYVLLFWVHSVAFTEVVQEEAEINILSVKPDKDGVEFEIQIPQSWHIYTALREPKTGKQTKFKFEGAIVAGTIKEPPTKHDEHEGIVNFYVPLKYQTGVTKVKGSIIYYICGGKDDVCMDGDTKFPEFAVPQGAVTTDKTAEEEELTSGGFFAFLVACVVGGLVSLVMPCVYPMLPLIIMFFAKQGGQGKKAKGFSLALMYGLGIIVTFTALGFILSIIIGAAGAQQFAADPWVNLVLSAIFCYLALALFGFVPLQLPGFVSNVGGAPKEGYLGAFVLGLIFSVVTFTCTIPVAAGLLSMAATGNRSWALIGMVVYSVTMAIPFTALGAFPALLRKIPKSGGWLHTIKIVTAFLEIGLCTYYLAKADFSFGWVILSRDVLLGIWIVVCIAIVLYLLCIIRLSHEDTVSKPGILRVVWVVIFIGLTGYFGWGMTGKYLDVVEALLPPREKLLTVEDYEKKLQLAKRENKLVFLEFTGFT